MKKALFLLGAGLLLVGCAPSQTQKNQTQKVVAPSTATAQFPLTCDRALSQLQASGAHQRPYATIMQNWRLWTELRVLTHTSTELVMTSERMSDPELMGRPALDPQFGGPKADSRLLSVRATCIQTGSMTKPAATLTLTSTGLEQSVMDDLNQRLLGGITEF